jgi:Transaldolase/Fructose-6-phosphate aldolase
LTRQRPWRRLGGLHERIAEPNLLVKIPATTAGVQAIQAMIAEGRSINIILIFSLARYGEVIEAYLAGLGNYARLAATSPACTASLLSSSAGSTPKWTGGWMSSAPRTHWRCGAGRRWRR